MLASVIINNYNYGRFLRESIDSALAQTRAATEVIVVDDGSTDDSREVITGYGGRVIAVLKDNGGQGSTYNAGFARSRGDVVCFLDSDDTLYPSAMERVAEAMAVPGVAKVQWPVAVTDAAGRATGEISTKRTPPEGDLRAMLARDGPYYDFDLHTGNAYARGALARALPMPEPPYRNGADVYLTTVAPVLGLVRNVHDVLGTYRAHGQNNYRGRALDDARVRNYIQRFETNCDALKRFLDAAGKHADPDAWRQRNFNYVWPTRLLSARADLARLVPAGSSLILVDDDEWGGGADQLPDRRTLPFLERDGEYWGAPQDDEMAVRELERLRRAGAAFVAFWWTSFWWLDEYRGFARHLRERFRLLLEGEHLIVFDLRNGSGK